MHDYDARAELEKLGRLTEAAAARAQAAYARGQGDIAALWERASRDYADTALLIAASHRAELSRNASRNGAPL